MRTAATAHSRIYDCEVTHTRTAPAAHAFQYRYFTFCLDLDEVDTLSRTSVLFGRAWFRPFRFVERDFIFGRDGTGIKAAVCRFAAQNGVTAPIARVELLAHMRTLGHAFNPAAFYYCYGERGELLCAIVEVTNTYREKKAYFIPAAASEGLDLKSQAPKHFYVSPFVDLEAHFDFRLRRPGERLYVQIDSLAAASRDDAAPVADAPSPRVVHAVVTGDRHPWTERALRARLLRYPWITLAVLARIHYQAARLFLKRVPYFSKSDRIELQKGGLP